MSQGPSLEKLKSILASSKQIMKKVENGDYQTGNIDSRALTEDGVQELYNEGVTRTQTAVAGYNESDVINSKLPSDIKKAMLEHPIQKITSPNYTFSLSDVEDMVEKNIPPKYNSNKPRQSNVINESVNQNGGTYVDEKKLNEMIENAVNKKLAEFFSIAYGKMLREETVKQTIKAIQQKEMKKRV